MTNDNQNSLVVTVSCKRGRKPLVKLGVMVGSLLFSASMLTACGSGLSPAVETVAPSTPMTPTTSVEAIQSQMQKFEVAAFRRAISTLEGNYTDRSVLAANLQSLSSEVTKLNARLALDDVFENEDEIKQTIVDADKLVSRIDLADPLVVVDNAETATAELDALKASLGAVLDHYGLEHAQVSVERIELASPTYGGTVGDTLDLTPAVYPTMVTDAALTYESTDPSVAEVDANGSVILTGAGSAEITVTDSNTGVHTTLTVTSKAAPVAAKPQTPAQVQAPATPATPQAPQVQAPVTPQKPQQQTPQQQTPQTQTPQKPSGGTVSEPQFSDDFQESYDDMKEATGGKAGTMAELGDLSLEEQREIAAGFNW